MRLLSVLIDLYSLVVLVAVVVSWVPTLRGTPLVSVVERLTEPVLEPIRRVLPPTGGLDFSPMVLLFLLWILGRAI